MPIEATQLSRQPEPFEQYPKCHAYPFVATMRGVVQRSKRRWFICKKRDYCAVICSSCTEIVGYESPKTDGQAPTTH